MGRRTPNRKVGHHFKQNRGHSTLDRRLEGSYVCRWTWNNMPFLAQEWNWNSTQCNVLLYFHRSRCHRKHLNWIQASPCMYQSYLRRQHRGNHTPKMCDSWHLPSNSSPRSWCIVSWGRNISWSTGSKWSSCLASRNLDISPRVQDPPLLTNSPTGSWACNPH